MKGKLINKALLIVTRDIDKGSTGRVCVLRTAYKCFKENSVDIKVIVLGASKNENNGEMYFIKSFSLRSILNAIFRFLFYREALNYNLMYTRAAESEVCKIINEYQPDLVYFDMVRSAKYMNVFHNMNARLVLDYDDLLSKRYKSLSSDSSITGKELFGYMAGKVPNFIIDLLGMFIGLVLRAESAYLSVLERKLASRFDAVSLVSSVEARVLSEATGREVADCPMSVGVSRTYIPDFKQENALLEPVFLGSTSYYPNLKSLIALRKVWDHERLGKVLVVGSVTENHKVLLGHKCFDYKGFIESLDDELLPGRIMLCPILSGTGIKTKVLDGLARGMVVVGTSVAFEGTGLLEQNNVCVTLNNLSSWNQNVFDLMRDLDRCELISKNAAAYFAKCFSDEVVFDKWRAFATNDIT